MRALSFVRSIEGLTFNREPRYRCRECQDTGFVRIWHPNTIKAALKDPDSVKLWKTVSVRCTCSKSDKVAEVYKSGSHEGKPIPTFGDKPWHINAAHANSKVLAATYEHKPEGFVEELNV